MTCKQQKTAREDLQHVVEKLLHIEFSDGTMNRIDTDTQSTQTVSPNKGQSEVAQLSLSFKQKRLCTLTYTMLQTHSVKVKYH